MSIAAADFYVTGGTLPPGTPSYVPRQADADLYEGLLRGEFCYVLTSRQMGKSSLMAQTTLRLRDAGITVVNLDLTRLGQNLTVEQWYDGLLGHLGRQLDLEEELEEYWLGHDRLSALQRWLGALQGVVLPGVGVRCSVLGVREGSAPDRTPSPAARVPAQHLTPGRLVIAIDEIDCVRSLPFSTDEFFAAIRDCYNRRTQDPEFARLTFCLLGVATPSDLIQDTRTTPFNIGRRIELTDFTAAEAAPLALGWRRRDAENKESKGRRELIQASRLLERVLYWTGGHPYLTQRLCQVVAEEGGAGRRAQGAGQRQDPSLGPDDVDRLCAALFLSHRARERDDNLLFVRDRLLRSEADPSRVLALYLSVHSPRQKVADDETNPLVSHLRLSGIVREQDGFLKVRNRIYARVFDRAWAAANMPDAELRRLRALAREQSRRRRLAEEQRRLAEERELTARRYLYAAHMNLVQQAWEVGNLARAQEVLETHRPKPRQEELRGFEWRYLWRLCQGEDGVTLRGHTGPVNEVVFSPDGTTLASASSDQTVKLWDVGSWRERATLCKHEGAVWRVAFSPDGHLLASCSAGGAIWLCDIATGREISVLHGHAAQVTDLAFSPDGQVLAVGNANGTVTLWDLARGLPTASLEHRARVDAVLFSPDGKMLASGGTDCTAKLWDVDPTQRVLDPLWVGEREIATLAGHRGHVRALCYSPDGRTLATGAGGGDIRLWDLSDRQEIAALTGQRGATGDLAFSPDGKILAAASQNSTVKRWNTDTWEAMRPLRGHRGSVRSVAFSPDGNTLASGSDDSTVKLWEMPERGRRDVLVGHTGWMTSVAFSPDGKLLASGSATGDRAVRLWDCATQQQIAVPQEHGGEVWTVAFSPGGRLLAWGSDRQIVLWDLAEQQQIAPLQGDPSMVRAIAFSPDGRTLAFGGREEHSVKLWDVATRSVLSILEGHQGSVYSLAFSPDGRTLASASGDGTARLWDVTERQELGILIGHEDLVEGAAFSPDGKLLATGSWTGMTVKLWDVGSMQEAATLGGHAGGVVAVAFSPDGKRLATGSSDNTIKLWDIATRQEVASLEGHTSAVNAVAFSPDGNILASAGPDATIRLWRAASFAETDGRAGPRLRPKSPSTRD